MEGGKALIALLPQNVFQEDYGMYKLKLGTSAHFFENDGVVRSRFEEELDELKALGFEAVDFDITGVWSSWNMPKANAAMGKGLQAIKDRGLILNGVHLPYRAFKDYSCPDETYRKSIVAEALATVKAIDPYQPKCYIFHGSAESFDLSEREVRKEALKRSLLEMVTATDTMMCVENLPRHCMLNTAKETIEVVDSVPNIKICCDTNHFLQEKTEDAVLAFGERIGALHISDHDYINERHVLPKDGKINWMKVLENLETIGYDGVFNYEIAMKAGNYVLYTFADIKRNYDELFAEYEIYKQNKK